MLTLAVTVAAIAFSTPDPWPLERQDRYGTGRAISGLAPSDYGTPWRQFELGGGFISTHGPSIRADGVGFFGRWVDNTVRRFNTATGQITGTFSAGAFVSCTPALSNGRIIVSTDSPNGRLWGVDSTNMFADWFQTVGYSSGSPNLGPEGDIVFARASGEVTRCNPATGAPIWTKTGFGVPRGSVVFTRDDQFVIMSHGSNVTCFRWSDGMPMWTYPGTVAVGGPGVAPDGTIVFGDDAA